MATLCLPDGSGDLGSGIGAGDGGRVAATKQKGLVWQRARKGLGSSPGVVAVLAMFVFLMLSSSEDSADDKVENACGRGAAMLSDILRARAWYTSDGYSRRRRGIMKAS